MYTPSPHLISKRVVLILVVLIALYLLEIMLEYWRGQMPLEGILFSVVMGIVLLFTLALMFIAVEQHFVRGGIDERLYPLIYWTPRVGMVLFALFISLFALDVIGVGYSMRQTILALLIHLVPSFILLVAMIAAWRWEWIGAVILIGWALWYILTSFGFPLIVYIHLSGLPFVLGILFLINWRLRVHSEALI